MTPTELQTVEALRAAVAVLGSQSALASALGKAQGHVYHWLKTGRIPLDYCAPIERATGGAVTRQMLRSADWRDHWPELSEPNPPPAPDYQAQAAINNEVTEEAARV